MEKVDFHQIMTLNNAGNQEYITTGATLNQTEYIALPTILGMYDTSDPTLRKYIKKYGTSESDYFFSDGKLFISTNFLIKNHFYRKKENTTTFHPYRKKRIKGSVIPYSIVGSL